MSSHPLFLGLPLTGSLLQKFQQLPLSLKEAFVQHQSADYLQQIEYEGVSYLGKCINPPFELTGLDALEIHIQSLLKKLIPDYSDQETNLLLFPLPLSS